MCNVDCLQQSLSKKRNLQLHGREIYIQQGSYGQTQLRESTLKQIQGRPRLVIAGAMRSTPGDCGGPTRNPSVTRVD